MKSRKKKTTILGIALITFICSACAVSESGKPDVEEALILAAAGTMSRVSEWPLSLTTAKLPFHVLDEAETAQADKTAESADHIEKYIVEDQEYLYSPYGDIGQLGEEGYYFSASFPTTEETETIAYQTKADVTHDGVEDLIQLSIYAEDIVRAEDFLTGYLGVAYVKVFRGIADGEYEDHPRFISRGYDASHVGNGTICVTHKDGQDYLLLSTIYEMQGEATYDYAVIYIDDENGIVMEDSGDAAFAVWEEMHEDWSEQIHRNDVMPAFQKKIEPWIEEATILVSFDIDSGQDLCSMEQEFPAEAFFDTVWEREW